MSTNTIRRYAGIGSRLTPAPILDYMTHIAKTLSRKGFVLRSGGADGADLAFEQGAGENAEIFTPDQTRGMPYSPGSYRVWEAEAETLHPNWQACGDFARRAHSRNIGILQGTSSGGAPPVEFILCWTPDCATEATPADASGGTATAIRWGHRMGVPVVNLADSCSLGRLRAVSGCSFGKPIPDVPAIVVESIPKLRRALKGEMRYYIGRGSARNRSIIDMDLGNPHPVGMCRKCGFQHGQGMAVEAYLHDLDSLPDHLEKIQLIGDQVEAAKTRLVSLWCWCKHKRDDEGIPFPCHGDVIRDRLIKRLWGDSYTSPEFSLGS